LVYDFGAAILDVSVLEVRGRSKGSDGMICEEDIRILSTASDPYLGGRDFTERMVDFGCHVFRETRKRNVSRNVKVLGKMRKYAERMKKDETTREEFENLCSDLFDRCLLPVKAALQKAEKNPGDIDDYILIGGASEMPKIRQLMNGFFGKARYGAPDGHGDRPIAVGAAGVALNKAQEIDKEGLVLMGWEAVYDRNPNAPGIPQPDVYQCRPL
jgi:heat shock protein 5